MKKKLTKSRKNAVLTGALGGIAEYFGIDATIVRLIFVLITFGSFGAAVVLYIIMALLIPSADGTSGSDHYGHNNPYYSSSRNSKTQKRERKEAEKVDDDDWSDF